MKTKNVKKSRNAKKPPRPGSLVANLHLRLPTSVKARWQAAAEANGEGLSMWMVRNLKASWSAPSARYVSEDPSDAQISVRILPSMKASFEETADACGLSLTAWIIANLEGK